MAYDRHYIPAFSIEDVLLDKDTGQPLSGGKVYFYRDDQRGTLKDVYQITGADPLYTFVPMANPVVLSSIGTFEDTLGNPQIPYFYPFDSEGEAQYYWVRVFNSDGVPQFDRETVPYIPDLFVPTDEAITFNNEITNPQFTQVLFDTIAASYTITFNPAPSAQVVSIAPGWDIIVTGAINCTVTLARVAPTGNSNLTTNPPYLLDINSSAGVTSLKLRQRFYGSPSLWAGEYLSVHIFGRTLSGTATNIQIDYTPSDPVTPIPLFTAILPATNAYVVRSDSAAIPVSTSTQSAPGSYVDITFDIPPVHNVQLTSIQIASTGTLSVTGGVAYDETSSARQQDQMFNYYQPQLNFKPIPSMLTGWDFPLNPTQFNAVTAGTVVIGTNAAYIWDQTIAGRAGSDFNVIRSALTGGLQATATGATSSFFLIQYLTGAEAKKILGTKLSVNVNAHKGTVGSAVTCRVYLYRGSSAAVFPDLNAANYFTIGGASAAALTTAGVFTKNAVAGQGLNWTLINRDSLGQAYGTLDTLTANTNLNDTAMDLKFSGWQITDATEIGNTDKFCIVVTFASVTNATVITVNSISVVPGDVPTRPAPQTLDEVRRECSVYYESSYPANVVPGTLSNGGLTFYQLGHTPGIVGNDGLYPSPFGVQYKVPKRTSAAFTVYSSAGTILNVTAKISQSGTAPADVNAVLSANWNTIYQESTGISFLPANGTLLNPTASIGAATIVTGMINFHYTADARLGVV